MIIAVDIDEVRYFPFATRHAFHLGVNRTNFFAHLPQVLSRFIDQLVVFFNATASAYPFVTTTHLSSTTFFSYRFCEVWGGTDADSTIIVEAFFASPYFNLPLVPGAVAGLAALKAAGHDLHVVTSRQLFLEPMTRAWLSAHFGSVFTSAHFGNHWGKVGAKVSKPELCKKIGATLIIDDSVEYCRGCDSEGIAAILFGDFAWNQTGRDTLPDTVVACADWDAVCTQVAFLSKERVAPS